MRDPAGPPDSKAKQHRTQSSGLFSNSGFAREDYAFALPLNSELRRNINESLLSYIDTEEWRTMLREHLGQER